MTVIKSEPYNYRIVKNDDSISIFVLCGLSAAMYEKEITLTQTALNELLIDEDKLSKFLLKVRTEQ